VKARIACDQQRCMSASYVQHVADPDTSLLAFVTQAYLPAEETFFSSRLGPRPVRAAHQPNLSMRETGSITVVIGVTGKTRVSHGALSSGLGVGTNGSGVLVSLCHSEILEFDISVFQSTMSLRWTCASRGTNIASKLLAVHYSFLPFVSKRHPCLDLYRRGFSEIGPKQAYDSSCEPCIEKMLLALYRARSDIVV
jgi:hypothetical protein